MDEKKKKTKIIGVILGIFAFIALVGGATYAWLTWRSSSITISGSSECFDIVYYRKDLGTAQNPAILKFMTDYNHDNINQLVANPNYAEVGLSLDPNCSSLSGLGKLYLTTNVSTSEEILTGGLYYTLVKVENNVETFIKEGPITSTGDMLLLNNIFVSTTTGGIKYRVYIWINGPITTDPDYVGASYIGEIRGEVESRENTTPPVNAAEYITSLYTNATKTVVTNNSIDYNYATSVSLMNDRLGGTSQSLDGGNIRYYGENPNNYIDIGNRTQVTREVGNWGRRSWATFSTTAECLEYLNDNSLDDEWAAAYTQFSTAAEFCSTTIVPAGTPILYRIIGVFDNMVKVISESIGDFSWDYSTSLVNNGGGINEWTQADVMKLLNPGYENSNINNSLYWNAGSGTCYYNLNFNQSTISCDFTNIGLTSGIVRDKIAIATWNLGSLASSNVFSNMLYGYERGTTHITSPADNVTREDSWTGKVGLIYPSDYGYAADFNNCTGTILNYNNVNCTNNNWLYVNKSDCWTISTTSNSSQGVFYLSSAGRLSSVAASSGLPVRPVFYLKSDEVIISGTGTESDPYVLG